jgi:hypothetical protein
VGFADRAPAVHIHEQGWSALDVSKGWRYRCRQIRQSDESKRVFHAVCASKMRKDRSGEPDTA